MLRHADPVEAELLDVFEAFDHAAIRLGTSLTVVHAGRYRPLARQRFRRAIANGLEERDFHRAFPSYGFAGGATDTPWTAFFEIAWPTKPDAFTSSTNARRNVAVSFRAFGVPIACGPP